MLFYKQFQFPFGQSNFGRRYKMLLSFFGGLLSGSGAVVLFQRDPLYPKPIAAVFVLVGIALIVYGIASPSMLL